MIDGMDHVPFKIASKSLGALCRRAQAGETLIITRYGRPVAALGPAPTGAQQDSSGERLAGTNTDEAE